MPRGQLFAAHNFPDKLQTYHRRGCMDKDQITVTEKDSPVEPTKDDSSAPIVFDSNPFTATWAGVQKLIKINPQTVIGTTLFNVLLVVLIGLTAAVILFAILALIIKHIPDLSVLANAQFGIQLGSMSDISLYITLAAGFVIIVFLIAFLQLLQLTLAVSSARSRALRFSELFKKSMSSIFPIIGYGGIVIVAFIVGFLVLAILAPLLGFITVIIGIVLVLAATYALLRLTYTPYSIVDLRLDPISAMKRSWALTDGHVIETVGSAAVSSLIIVVPSIVLSALARVTEGISFISSLFSLVQLVLSIILIVVSAMALAERYVQLDAVENKETVATPFSPYNYLAIVIVVVLLPILSALSPKSASLNGSGTFNLNDNSQSPGSTNIQVPNSLN